MSEPNNKVIIDTLYANIVDKYSQDKAILIGTFPFENSSYSENLELVIKPEVGYPIKIELSYSGFDMQLFCGDFTNDDRDEIMVRGSFGGSGGYEIGVIYELKNSKIIEIFNQNDISKNNPCAAKFKDNYKVHVNCGDKKYSINLATRPQDYLELAYDKDGKVLPGVEAYVDAPNSLFPIKDVDNSYYELLIQTLCNFLDSKFNIVTKGLYFTFDSGNKDN